MKVNGHGSEGPRPQRAAESQGASSPRGSSTGRPAASPERGGVELSPEAQAFLKVRSMLDGLAPASREDRIARIRADIASGRYAVDGERIADAMLRDPGAARMLGLAR